MQNVQRKFKIVKLISILKCKGKYKIESQSNLNLNLENKEQKSKLYSEIYFIDLKHT